MAHVERIAAVYVYPVNLLFKILYAIVSIFIDKRTKQKFHFCNNAEQALVNFDKKYLLKEMGGTSEFDYRNEVFDYKDIIIESGGILSKEELKESEEEEIIEEYKQGGDGDDEDEPIPPDEGKRLYYKILTYKTKEPHCKPKSIIRQRKDIKILEK